MMLKVKMISRHRGLTGMLEQGLKYLLPRTHAQELINHGLAELAKEEEKVAAIVEKVVEAPPKPQVAKPKTKSGTAKKN